MLRIDAHQHFWQYNPVRDSWINESMGVLKRDFLPQHLAPLLTAANMDGCVLVQAEQTDEGNNFLLQQAAASPLIKGIVAWVDLQANNIEERLAYYQQHAIIKGFRHILQGEEDRALMLKPNFLSGMGFLKSYGYTYDILIFPDQLQYAVQLVAKNEAQPFVVDHLAKPYIKNKEIEDWKKDISAIAQHPNVWCKVSGLVTEGDWNTWQKEDLYPYLDVVVEAFGIKRLMFGSDWPVCLLAASYAQTVALIEDYFAPFTKKEKEGLFGGNAAHFYKLT